VRHLARAGALATILTIAASPLSAQTVPAAQPGTVMLPLTEYNRLLDAASRPRPITPQPPAGAVLTSADLRIKIDAGIATGVFNIAGQVLRNGWNRVALLSGATLIGGTNNGRPVPIVADGTGQAALLQGTGPFNLALDWGAPLLVQPGRASFTLPVPPAGTARATIDIPGEEADVRVSAGLITRRAAGNGRTTVEITLHPGGTTDVSWTLRDSAPVDAVRDLRTTADVLSLVTLGDTEVRVASVVDLSVVQGELHSVTIRLPVGYQVASVSGPTVDTSDVREDEAVITFTDATVRRHQFVLALERTHDAGSFAFETGFLSVIGAQRERGEVAVEGVGTLEVEATEREGVHRIDVRELNDALQSMARTPVLAAFRYQRAGTAQPSLIALNVKRFADAPVLAAGADQAIATTMVTSEGRALTEMMLRVRNRAQPFLKVVLPEGATLVSASVAGVAVKPVLGTDGTRVPLLRAGFRPTGPYDVSFVFLYSGTPFEKKGDLQMLLPKVDVPIGLVQWELFVPERYAVKIIDGNVIDARVVDKAMRGHIDRMRRTGASSDRNSPGGAGGGISGGVGGGYYAPRVLLSPGPGLPGEIRGRIVDSSGAVLPGTTVTVSIGSDNYSAATDAGGRYVVRGIPPGEARIRAELAGFTPVAASFTYDGQPRLWDVQMNVGSLEETVTVSGATPEEDRAQAPRFQPPSSGVLQLQQRAAGVLPIRIEVPRAGTSYQFIKPLVVGQEASVTLRYKRR
jgi:hypothetical protein